MPVKERLIAYIKFKGISVREFCRTIGVSETYVSSMRTSIQPKKLMIINEHYPDLNNTWLLTGNGDMLKENAIAPSVNRDEIVNSGMEVFKDKIIQMFVNGEIYSAAVVHEKDELIHNLYQKVVHLEDENAYLKKQLESK